jgi:tRNA threonylcarbamoyladenosine biosynthesis protein TsaB
MKIIAVNSATTIFSVALVEDGRVLHLFETDETRDQGNLLLKHVKQAMQEHSFKFEDIDLLAVVTGPGSFTGIRIGLAAMRGIALAAQKPIVGLSSFELFSTSEKEEVNIIAVESWREELYFQVLDASGQCMIEDVNQTPLNFFKRIEPLIENKNVTLSGDALQKLAAYLPLARNVTILPNAVDAARKAAQLYRLDSTPEKPIPYYLREADALVSYNARKI